jgi:hypothetical protein
MPVRLAAAFLAALVAGSLGGTASASGIRRPLHLPRLHPGAACPRTRGGHADPVTGITLGSGPVYPVLGFSQPPPRPLGVVYLVSHGGGAVKARGWYFSKTLWTVAPHYHGPVLIRGGRIDRPGVLRFASTGKQVRTSLTMSGWDASGSWRRSPAYTLVRGPGCYAFQLDGTTFSRIVVFEVAR